MRLMPYCLCGRGCNHEYILFEYENTQQSIEQLFVGRGTADGANLALGESL